MPDILKYHVVAGAVMSTDLKEGQEVHPGPCCTPHLHAAQRASCSTLLCCFAFFRRCSSAGFAAGRMRRIRRLWPQVETVLGKKLKITLAGGAKVNGVKVKKVDIKVSNGVLHSIEGVLLPPA